MPENRGEVFDRWQGAHFCLDLGRRDDDVAGLDLSQLQEAGDGGTIRLHDVQFIFIRLFVEPAGTVQLILVVAPFLIDDGGRIAHAADDEYGTRLFGHGEKVALLKDDIVRRAF